MRCLYSVHERDREEPPEGQLWVARVRCQHGWDENPDLRNKEVICYLTKDGQCSRSAGDAMLYDSEAEAWNHLGTTGNIGSEGGQDWSWVEPAH